MYKVYVAIGYDTDFCRSSAARYLHLWYMMIKIELHEASESVAPHEAHSFVPGTMSTNLQTLKCKIRFFCVGFGVFFVHSRNSERTVTNSVTFN